MTDLFLFAARNKLRFFSKQGNLTAEQLFDLPLTTTVANRASLNDVAVAIADELDTVGKRSFVSTASTSPIVTTLSRALDVVKAVIEIKQAENADAEAKRARRARRDELLDAISQADRRELGSKSADELRKQLADMDD